MCLEAISSCYYVIITPTIDIRDNFIQMINTNTSLDATQPQPQLQFVECAQVVLVDCVAVVLNECADVGIEWMCWCCIDWMCWCCIGIVWVCLD